jgi:hypothetical protein
MALAMVKKTPAIDMHSVSVSRFCMPDFTKYGMWLLDRLKEEWPQLTEKNVFGFLRGCSESREFSFLKSDHAVGLCQMNHKHLHAQPELEEIFVFVQDKGNQTHIYEGGALYIAFEKWRKTIGGSQIVIGQYSDVPHGVIAEAIGKVLVRNVFFVKADER